MALKEELNIAGVVVSNRAQLDVLRALHGQSEPIRVIPLRSVMNDKYGDGTLYETLTQLNKLKLVVLDVRLETIKGTEFRQRYWSLTDEARAFFDRQNAG